MMLSSTSNVLEDPFFNNLALAWSRNPETKGEFGAELQKGAMALLGGKGVAVPGNKAFVSSIRASEYGIFVSGATADKMKLYVNLGWFEDNFLNLELGFSDSLEGLKNINTNKAQIDEGKLFTKFNSKNSWAKYDTGLVTVQEMGLGNSTFLYPKTIRPFRPCPH